jgi:hypothetical protein
MKPLSPRGLQHLSAMTVLASTAVFIAAASPSAHAAPGNTCFNVARTVAVDADGGLVLAGGVNTGAIIVDFDSGTLGGGIDAQVATRLHTDGSIDTTWGGGTGSLELAPAARRDLVDGVRLGQTSTGIVIAFTQVAGKSNLLSRLNSGGSLDPAFSGDGTLRPAYKAIS